MIACHLRGATGAVCIFTAMTAMAAATSAPQTPGVYKGDAVALGDGTAYAWVSLDADGRPAELGVSMSEAVLASLEHQPPAEATLVFPPEAAGSGFEHVLLNWNPHGHPPTEIWGDPHFDVHFYMIPPAAREAISPDDSEFAAKAGRHPEASLLPAGYITDGKAVPGMGVHWWDAATPEFHGEPFTHTLLYGAWDGRVTFVEPMVTKAVFEQRETVVAPVKQPKEVANPGLLPTQYRIDFDSDAREHRVVLENLVAGE